MLQLNIRGAVMVRQAWCGGPSWNWPAVWFPQWQGGTILVITMAMACSSTIGEAKAQVLRCISPGGQMEFARTCPPGTRAEPTGIRNNPLEAPAKPEITLTERDAEFRKRRNEQLELIKKSELEARRAEDRAADCANALAYRKTLLTGMRIQRIDPATGETVFLDDTQRKSELQRAERAVDINCS